MSNHKINYENKFIQINFANAGLLSSTLYEEVKHKDFPLEFNPEICWNNCSETCSNRLFAKCDCCCSCMIWVVITLRTCKFFF